MQKNSATLGKYQLAIAAEFLMPLKVGVRRKNLLHWPLQ